MRASDEKFLKSRSPEAIIKPLMDGMMEADQLIMEIQLLLMECRPRVDHARVNHEWTLIDEKANGHFATGRQVAEYDNLTGKLAADGTPGLASKWCF